MTANSMSMNNRLQKLPDHQRDLLEQFSDFALNYRANSDRNVNNTLSVMDLFCRWGGPDMHLDNVTDKEIIGFLNTKKKSTQDDPDQRWKRTWKDYFFRIKTFYRWYCNKDSALSESEWKTPLFISCIRVFRDKRKASFSPQDVWTLDELYTVLKYFNNTRDKASFAIGYDIAARNHELTKLRLRHIHFTEQYCEITIPSDTKTGSRTIPIGPSLPYLRDWLNVHPSQNDPDSFVFLNLGNGKPLTPDHLWKVAKHNKMRIQNMIKNNTISKQDQSIMERILKKPWNPYLIMRHSSITEKASFMSDYQLVQYAGWVESTKRRSTYIHMSGKEIKNPLLLHYGVTPKEKENTIPINKCPQCKYDNTFQAAFCQECGFVLNLEGYDAAKDSENRLQNTINHMQNDINYFKKLLHNNGYSWIIPSETSDYVMLLAKEAGIPIDNRI